MENNYRTIKILKMKTFVWVQYRKEMNLPDGIFNGKYNSEPAIIRMEGGVPVYVSFIGFLKDGESRSSAIYKASGVLHSNVEILLPKQEI